MFEAGFRDARVRLGHRVLEGGCVEMEALYVDKYGNIKLSQHYSKLAEALGLEAGMTVKAKGLGERWVRVAEDLSTTPKGTLLLYEDASGLAEIALNQGPASMILGARDGDTIILCSKTSRETTDPHSY